MRRVLEAFSTFEYKKDISEISTDKEILSSIDEDIRGYFENIMYRLVLNEESHFESSTYDTSKIDFYDLLCFEEKQRTAKDVLSLIYLLNPSHLTSHLKCSKEDEKN